MIAADVQKDFQELGDACNAVFKESGNKPANTLFGGSLLLPWMKVEIEATAIVQAKKKSVSTGTPWEERCGCSRADAVGRAVQVSGTCAQGDTPTEQVQAIFKVIEQAVKDAGGRGLEDVVLVRMIAADVQKDFQELGDAVNAVFKESKNTPANTLFGGSLLQPWMKVEIEATAAIKSTRKTFISTGTPWEERCACVRAVRVGSEIQISGTCAQGDTPTDQVNAIFKVIEKAVKDAGGRGLEDITIVRMIGADVQKDFQELGDAVNGVFKESGNTPANTLFGGDLLLPWMKVEIEATAVVQPSPKERVLPKNAPIVLVTSATGRIGKEVVARLAQGGRFRVRACLHDESKEAYLMKLGAHETVKFELTDPETWTEALKNVSVVYSASLDPLLEHHLKFSAHLGTLGKQIKHVVRVSCMGADTNTASYDKDKHVTRDGAEIPLMLQHYWWGEKSLIDAKVPLTVLRANFFMNHLLKTDVANIDGEGWFSNPLGKTRNSFVCTNDIGEAAAVVIQQGPRRHVNKFYDLTGPQPQSMAEIAEDLGKAMGKTLEYRPQNFDQFEKDFGATRAGFFEYLSNGFYSRCSPDFYNITGKKPTSYAEYLVNKGASGETGLDELRQANLWKKGVDAMKDAVKK